MITWIFAVDESWNIGYEGDMIYWIKKDLKRFRQLTWGKAMLMGRNTFEALPGVLENREHYVLTTRENYEREGITVLKDRGEALELVKSKETFLIGGARVATDFLDETTDAYITEIKASGKAFDTSLPNLNTHGFHALWRTPLYFENALPFTYAYYTREPGYDFSLKEEKKGDERIFSTYRDGKKVGEVIVKEDWILSLKGEGKHFLEKTLCEVLHILVGEGLEVLYAKRDNNREPFILMGFDDEEFEDKYILRVKE